MSRSALAEIGTGHPHLDDPRPTDPGDADIFADPDAELRTALLRVTGVMLYREVRSWLPALATEPVTKAANRTLLPLVERVHGVSRL